MILALMLRSAEQETANLVAKRKRGKIIILEIKAGEAYRGGVSFYLGNEMVWLSDPIPPEYIIVPTA